MKRLLLASIGLLALLAGSAVADDMVIPGTVEFSGVGLSFQQEFEHEDDDPWKGWAGVTVKNTGTEAWGDFHFEIFQVTAETVENVDFTIDSPFEPTSSQVLDIGGIVVDNVAVGATLDLYFYGDPILPGDTATFTAYTDNTTDSVSFFGLAMYPTPVPEPSALALLCMAAFGLLMHIRRKR